VGDAVIDCVGVRLLPGEVSLARVEVALDVEEVVATVRVLNILKWTMLEL
jgi:hypothetical protein